MMTIGGATHRMMRRAFNAWSVKRLSDRGFQRKCRGKKTRCDRSLKSKRFVFCENRKPFRLRGLMGDGVRNPTTSELRSKHPHLSITFPQVIEKDRIPMKNTTQHRYRPKTGYKADATTKNPFLTMTASTKEVLSPPYIYSTTRKA